jgi:Restriction endonuclease
VLLIADARFPNIGLGKQQGNIMSGFSFSNSWEVAAQIIALNRRNSNADVVHRALSNAGWLAATAPTPSPAPQELGRLLIQTAIVPDAPADAGMLITAVAEPWFEIIEVLLKDPNAAFQIPPEKWEEIVAGAYKRAMFDEVILTPRSGDFGRDVIAVKKGIDALPPAGTCCGRPPSAPPSSPKRHGWTSSARAAARAGRSTCGPSIVTRLPR